MSRAAAVSITPAYEVVPLDKWTGMDTLRRMFPRGEANELNFVLFSTSGAHGSYLTIEEVEESLATKDAHTLTVLVVQPRTVRMLYGDIVVERDDIAFLRMLRTSTANVLREIVADA